MADYASAAESIEPIPETSAAERIVADVQAIGAPAAVAERVRDSVPLWFHTFALAPGVYTPGIARDHGYRLAVLGADRFAGRSVLDGGPLDARRVDAEVVEGRPAKTIDVPADDGTTCRYCLAEWVQSGQSAAYSFLYRV